MEQYGYIEKVTRKRRGFAAFLVGTRRGASVGRGQALLGFAWQALLGSARLCLADAPRRVPTFA